MREMIESCLSAAMDASAQYVLKSNIYISKKKYIYTNHTSDLCKSMVNETFKPNVRNAK